MVVISPVDLVCGSKVLTNDTSKKITFSTMVCFVYNPRMNVMFGIINGVYPVPTTQIEKVIKAAGFKDVNEFNLKNGHLFKVDNNLMKRNFWVLEFGEKRKFNFK